MALTQVQGGMLAGSTNTTTTIQSNGTTAITIDSSQNVGIGTSNPAAVTGFSTGRTVLQVSPSGGGSAQLRLGGSSGTMIDHDDNGNTITTIRSLYGATSASAQMQLQSGFITFGTGTSFTERMRIASGGGIALNGTAPPTIGGVGAQNGAFGLAGTGAWALGIEQGTTSAGGGRVLALRNVTDFNNTGNEVIYYTGNTTARFYVVSNGGIYNYQANNSNLSDRREKTNIAPAGEYLSKICAIPVQTFNYIDQNMEDDAGTTLGVIAQDVQSVAPELVTENNWGTKDEPKMRLSIYQTDLQYALMKCIQELKAELDATKAEVAALKAAP